MITTLHVKSPRQYEVKLLRNSRSEPRKGNGTKTVYQDDLVRIVMSINDNKKPVGYDVQFRGSRSNPKYPVVREESFWVAVFYREHKPEYQGRDFKVVYNDTYIRLLKYGDENPDYVFFTLCPPPEHRVGDKRFSTIANTHPIEEEVMEVTVSLGDDDG